MSRIRLVVLLLLVMVTAVSAQGPEHRVPAYTLGTLPAAPALGVQGMLSNGGAIGALLMGDGTNWNCGEAKSLKVVIVTCPPYNARGDGVTDDYAAIQAAINASVGVGFADGRAPIYLPTGHYRVSQPLIVTNQATVIRGAGRAKANIGGTVIVRIAGNEFPVLYYVRSSLRTDLRFGTALVTGAGSALEVRGATNDTYIDFQEALPRRAFNGLSSFSVECFFKMSMSGTLVRHLISSKGQRTSGEAASTTFDIQPRTDGTLVAILNVNGTLQTLLTGSVLVADTVHHVALTYDGTTIRLFVDGVLVQSAVAAGTISQGSFDNGSIGAYRQIFPNGGIWTEGITGFMDSIRISNTVRYTAPFTPPTAKLANDANTLFLENFDNEVTDFSKVSMPFGTYWLTKYYTANVGNHTIARQELGNMQIDAGRGMAVAAWGTTESYFHDLTLTGHIGLALLSDTFVSDVARVTVSASSAAGRIGILQAHQGGISTYRDLTLTSFDYGLILNDGSGVVDNVYITGARHVGIILGGTEDQFNLRSIRNSTEGVTDPKYEAALILRGKQIHLSDSTIEGAPFTVPPIWVDGTGTITISDTYCTLQAGTTQVIRVLAAPTMQLATHGVFVTPASVPLSLSHLAIRPVTHANTTAYAPVTNTASETYFGISGDGKLTAGVLNSLQRRMEIVLAGVWSTGLSTGVTVRVKLCTVSGCGSGTVTHLGVTTAVTPLAALTNRGWTASIIATVVSPGTSGVVDAQGQGTFYTSPTTALPVEMANAAMIVPVNTTVDQYVSVSVQPTLSHADTTITLRNFGVKVY